MYRCSWLIHTRLAKPRQSDRVFYRNTGEKNHLKSIKLCYLKVAIIIKCAKIVIFWLLEENVEGMGRACVMYKAILCVLRSLSFD